MTSSCSKDRPSGSVAPPPVERVVSISIEPSDFLLFENAQTRLGVTVLNQLGNKMTRQVVWSTSDPAVAGVDESGNVSGIAHGAAEIVARADGVEGSATAQVRERPPPPPPSGQHFLGDFSSAMSDADLQSMVQINTQGNVHADPGVGMRYDFQAFPNRCNDQSLASIVNLPPGTKEVWIRFRIRFSSNWTTRNDNCQSPSPDYKTVLTWLDKKTDSGHTRFNFKIGQGVTNIMATVPGFPQVDAVPLSVVKKNGAQELADNRWHTVELHQRLVGDDESLFQAQIDGVETHNYRTRTSAGLVSRWLNRINIGANRNLGATTLMRVWWDDFEIFVGDDPGGFNFSAPTAY
ncbi:MAG: Ig domain-containing protein [Gemmatimonadota bacterium]